MARNPWWGTDGRIHIPVDAVVEPNVGSSPSGGEEYQPYRRSRRYAQTQQSEGGFFRLLGILLVVFLVGVGIFSLLAVHQVGWDGPEWSLVSASDEKECDGSSILVGNNADGVPFYRITPNC